MFDDKNFQNVGTVNCIYMKRFNELGESLTDYKRQ